MKSWYQYRYEEVAISETVDISDLICDALKKKPLPEIGSFEWLEIVDRGLCKIFGTDYDEFLKESPK